MLCVYAVFFEVAFVHENILLLGMRLMIRTVSNIH